MDLSPERFCIFGLFGAALALFCWRHATSEEMRPPASLTLDEVPDTSPMEQAWLDPALIVGMSYAMGAPELVPWYKATNPNARPPLPPRRSAVL